MKVLHITETLKGGVATYLNELINHQCSSQELSSIHLIYPDQHEEELCIPAGTKIPARKTGRSLWGLIKFGMFASREIKRIKPDVVHLHSTFAGFLIRTLNPFLSRKVKVIYCPHGWAFLSQKPMITRTAYLAIEILLQINTTKIINISKYEHLRSLRLGISRSRCVLITNAIQPPPTKNNKPECLQAHKHNFIFVGRFDRQKGYDIFLDICRHFSKKDLDIGFFLIGDFVIEKNKGSVPEIKNLYNVGWLRRSEIFDYFYGATALIMPSRWEGFGLVAIESLLCCCPVIGSDQGALPEILEHPACKILNIGSFAEDACSYIEQQLESINGEAIDTNHLLNKYSYTEMSQKIIATYESCQ